ncbi:Rossmann-like and DUF2520 domain-containing protein [Roseateles sp. GG27B]
MTSSTQLRQLAFIGTGRLGQTLALAFAKAGEAVVAVASRGESAGVLAARLPGCQVMTAAEAVQAAELVFLTVPDDAIAALALALPWRAGQAVVHCSGATEVAALAAAALAGASVGGFHPLQIFSDPARAAGLLAGSAVAIEAEEPLQTRLQELARLLAMKPLQLPAGARAAYHGAASFAGSYLLSMLDEAVQVWAAVGIPADQALQALLPLAQGTLQAAGTRGLAGALAGPISRGDVGVVAAHLQAFDRLGGAHGEFYRQLSLRQLSLARLSGRLDEAVLQRFEELLLT